MTTDSSWDCKVYVNLTQIQRQFDVNSSLRPSYCDEVERGRLGSSSENQLVPDVRIGVTGRKRGRKGSMSHGSSTFDQSRMIGQNGPVIRIPSYSRTNSLSSRLSPKKMDYFIVTHFVTAFMTAFMAGYVTRFVHILLP